MSESTYVILTVECTLLLIVNTKKQNKRSNIYGMILRGYTVFIIKITIVSLYDHTMRACVLVFRDWAS